MDLTAIENEYKRYQNAKSLAMTMRDQWLETKKTILKTLKHIKSKIGIEAQVDVEDKMEGMEIIYLSFGQDSSGIFEKIGHARRPIIKEGGSLFYTQLFTGKIGVWQTLPHIKKLSKQHAPEKIGVFIPEEITPKLILEHVEGFITSLADWEEKDISNDSIGFKLKR